MSTVVGAVTGALLQAWRERVTHRREMARRWDETLLAELAAYLSAADVALRAMLRWRHVRDAGEPDLAQAAAEAVEAFEAVHEKSHVITLLTGEREHPVREAARRMRQALLPLCEEIHGRQAVPDGRVRALVAEHRDARTVLIREAQRELKRPT